METYEVSDGTTTRRLVQSCCPTLIELENYLRSLTMAPTNCSRVNIVYNDLKKHNLFFKLVEDTKNDASALDYREMGNKHFGKGNYLKALEDYTRSITTSKTPSVQAVAYANRSACLFRLDRHKECIDDIERALAHDYPDELKEKIIKRRQQAEKLQKPLEKYHEEVPKIPKSQRNPMIQSANSCVKIEYNEEYGKHIVATRDIEIDEIIAVEKPFACVLREGLLIHCHHCMELCYNPIPCSSCTQAVFCGETCKDQAQIYHKYECSILLTLSKHIHRSLFLTLRTALLAKGEYEQMESYRFDKNEYYRSDRYKEIHCLLRKRPGKEVLDSDLVTTLTTTIIVAMVFHWLQTTDIFKNEIVGEHFKEVMLSQMHIIPWNGISVSEYVQNNSQHKYTPTQVADASFSFSSLFNHSCARFIGRYWYGTTAVFRSSNKIKKGEQCFINYGEDYNGTSKQERQFTLNRKYSFICKCIACEEDWKATIVNSGRLMNLPKNSKVLNDIEVMIKEADVQISMKMLPTFLEKLKKCEHTEPRGHALTLKVLVTHCYGTMGNKRRM